MWARGAAKGRTDGLDGSVAPIGTDGGLTWTAVVSRVVPTSAGARLRVRDVTRSVRTPN